MSSVSKEINDILKTLKGEETDGVCGSSNRAKACYNIQQAIKGNSDFKNITNGSNAKGVNEIAKYVLKNGIGSGGTTEKSGRAVQEYKNDGCLLKIREKKVVKSDLPTGTVIKDIIAHGKGMYKNSSGTYYKSNSYGTSAYGTFETTGLAEKDSNNKYPIKFNISIDGVDYDKTFALNSPLRGLHNIGDTLSIDGTLTRKIACANINGDINSSDISDITTVSGMTCFKYKLPIRAKANMKDSICNVESNFFRTCVNESILKTGTYGDGMTLSDDGQYLICAITSTSLTSQTASGIVAYFNNNGTLIFYEMETPTIEHLTSNNSDILALTDVNKVDIKLDNNLYTYVEVVFDTEDNYAIDFISKKRGVAWNGRLRLINNELCNQYGTQFQLKGISTQCLGLDERVDNTKAYDTIKDYGANVLRLAMHLVSRLSMGGKQIYGYNNDPDIAFGYVKQGIQWAINNDMYVVADYHGLYQDLTNNLTEFTTKATEFFDDVLSEFGVKNNIIYEIFNEPKGTWANIKTYADTLIAKIRETDANGIIICPTVNYDTDWSGIASNQLTSASNVLYTQHFYNGFNNSILSNIPPRFMMFVTEFGCGAEENESLSTAQFDKGDISLDVFNRLGISYIMWALRPGTDNAMSFVKEDTTKKGGWTRDELSTSGKWLVNKF